MDAVDCGGLSLDKPQIDAIEKAICDMKVGVVGVWSQVGVTMLLLFHRLVL